MRRFKVVMEVARPQGVMRKEGHVEAANALNAIGHAILRFGVKTDELTHLAVTLDAADGSGAEN